MTQAVMYVLTLTPAQRAQIAHDLAIAIDEGQSVVDDATLAALGLVVRNGWGVVLAESVQ